MIWVIVTSGIIIALLVAMLWWQTKKIEGLQFQQLLLIKNLDYYQRKEARAAANIAEQNRIAERAAKAQAAAERGEYDWAALQERIRKLTSDGDN